jgi:hypothetical protein
VTRAWRSAVGEEVNPVRRDGDKYEQIQATFDL